jgi:hypothetical protein
MAEQNEVNEAAKKQLAADRELTEKSRAEFMERMKGKPTPTQEENDLAALGHTFTDHEDDGSGPDPNVQSRSLEGNKPGGYQTRHVQSRPAATHQQPPRRTE